MFHGIQWMTHLKCQAECALMCCWALPGIGGVLQKAHTPWLAIAALRGCVTWHLPRLSTSPCWCLQEESLCHLSSWCWAVSPCKTQQLLLPPAFMETETSILTSSSSELLPGNSKIKFYKVVWFASQLSPKGPALWISCFIGALTLFALWAVGIMFRKVRILLKCKNIIPKFALYQVRSLMFLVRFFFNCWYDSASLVLAPLLKIYGIFSH